MSQRPDKQRRKELLDTARAKQRGNARSSFPASNEITREFFEMLNERLQNTSCDHSFRISTEWLTTKGIAPDHFLKWMRSNGGYCDCEALMNASERWEDANHDVP